MKRLSIVLALVASATVACTSDTGDTDDSVEPDCATPESCARTDAVSNEPPPFTFTGPARATRFPILLHHGFNASKTNGWSYYRVEEALVSDGHTVTKTEVEPFNGVPERAKRLAVFVDAALVAHCAKAPAVDRAVCAETAKVNIIAHSMGGLDARYLAATLKYAPKIASITTISTPHHGSAVADVGLGLTPDGGKMGAVMDFLFSAFGRTFTNAEVAGNTNVRAAFESLSEAHAAEFNRLNPDQARTFYQSYAGVSRAIGGPRTIEGQKEVLQACGKYFGDIARADFMALDLIAGSVVVSHFTSAPQDGMVTVENAKWTNFRGCFPADHLEEVGQAERERANVYTQFDHVAFYRTVATDLAARGF